MKNFFFDIIIELYQPVMNKNDINISFDHEILIKLNKIMNQINHIKSSTLSNLMNQILTILKSITIYQALKINGSTSIFISILYVSLANINGLKITNNNEFQLFINGSLTETVKVFINFEHFKNFITKTQNNTSNLYSFVVVDINKKLEDKISNIIISKKNMNGYGNIIFLSLKNDFSDCNIYTY
jgi:hypothetical protein